MDHQLRRTALAGRLPELAVDAFLITGLTNVRYLTGFTGSNGQALVAGTGSVFFTDGRYTEQSRHEVADMDRVTARARSPRAWPSRPTDSASPGSASRPIRSRSERSSGCLGAAGYHAGAVGR